MLLESNAILGRKNCPSDSVPYSKRQNPIFRKREGGNNHISECSGLSMSLVGRLTTRAN